MRPGRQSSRGSKDGTNQQRRRDPDLSLQGQHVASHTGSDCFGLGVHAGLSAYDLCYQSSGESSASSSWLPPVPSLPGISAPASSPGKSQQLQLHKKSSSAGSSVSPVKLRTWQVERKAAQQPAGAISSYTLPKTNDIAGFIGSSPKLSSTSHLLPAIHGPSANKSAQGHLEQHDRSAGSPTPATNAKTAVKTAGSTAGSAGMGAAGAAQQQMPKGSMLDSTQHLTTIVLPPDVVTGEDAIRYFGSGAGKSSDIIYCNLAVPCSPCFSSNGQQTTSSSRSTAAGTSRTGGLDSSSCGDDAVYNPYDLRAVRQQDANKQQHFIVSYNGVIHMRAGEPPELTCHAEWLRQTELFYVLSHLSFFKQHKARLAFSTWHRNIVGQKLAGHSKQLESKLLVRHSGVSSCLQKVHILLEAYLAAADDTAGWYPADMLDDSSRQTATHGAEMLHPTASTTAASTAVTGPTGDNLPVQGTRVQMPAAAQSTGVVLPEPLPDVAVARRSSETVAGGPLAGQGSSQATTAQGPVAAVQAAVLAEEPVTVVVQSNQSSDALVAAGWDKSAAKGKWKLVRQRSGRLYSSNIMLQQPTALQDANSSQSTSGALAIPDLLLEAPPPRGVVLASGGASVEQKQPQQEVGPAPIKILPLLTAVVPTEGVVTANDLAAWRSRNQQPVAAAMCQLHAQLLNCLQQLEQNGNARLQAEQAAAAAAEQEAKQAGRKALLPWNEAVAYDLKRQQRDLAATLVRVARWIDVMATSHAARLASAAIAHVISCLIAPRRPSEGLQLCHQQFGSVVAAQAKEALGRQTQHNEGARRYPGVQVRVHVDIRDTEELLSKQQRVGHGAVVCTVRFTPDLDELISSVSNLPLQLASMINLLPLMSNELLVASWRQLTSRSRQQQQQQPASPGHGGATVPSVADVRHTSGDGSRSPDSGTPVGGAEVGGRRIVAVQGKSFKARNARLEVLLATSDALRVQAKLVALIHQHFIATHDSSQLQPLREATPLVLLCSTFDPETYLQLQTSARQLAADVTAVGTWLGHLTECSPHSVSVAHVAGSVGCESYSGDGGCKCCGCVVMDVAMARATMLKMAGATLGSMFSVLHSAFMRHCRSLHAQLDATIATLQQRPDTLQPFTTWLASILGHLLPGVAAGMGTGRGLSMMLAQESAVLGPGSLQDQPKDRAVLMAEFEALRSLMDVMRPGSGNPIAGLLTGSASMRPGSPGYEARETAAVPLRHLGPAPVRAATTALSELQARIMVYKDAARVAGGHAASGAKNLAHEMTQHMTQAREQLVELLVNLRTADPSKSSCPAAIALQHIDRLKNLHDDTSEQEERHLLAAELFKEKGVVESVQVFKSLSNFLSTKLSRLSDFRSAQLAWSAQLEALYRTSAVSEECREQLQQLEHCGQQLLQHVQQIEMLHPGDDVCSSTTATADELQLAAAVKLDLAAWQARWPLGSLLTDAGMHRKHRLLLLQLMCMAEPGALHSILPHLSLTDVGVGSVQQQDGSAADFAYVRTAMQHYGLAKLDSYQSRYLHNAAAAAEQRGSDDEGFSINGSNVNINSSRGPNSRGFNVGGIFWRSQLAAGLSAADDGADSVLSEGSVASLLVWISGSQQAGAVLDRVLQVAQAEQQLSTEVTAVYDELSSLTLHLSNSRVAGCFMMTNLQQLAEALQALQVQLRVVARHECHLGVEGKLLGVQLLQQQMLSTVKACESAQSKLLAVHNLYHHPALCSCLTAQHKALYTAAVKAWAPAVLKVCSSSSTSHKQRRSSYAEEGGTTDRPGAMRGYSLMRHHGALSAAAQSALLAVHKARTAAGPVMATELQSRWPRLVLAPQESLLQLLEQLPATFRAAAAQQAIRLPIPLLDTLFRGVTHLLPAPRSVDAQVLTVGSPGAPQSVASTQQQQQQQGPGRWSTVAPQTATHPPGSACSIIITGDESQSAAAVQQIPTVSGCLHEAISAGEGAATRSGSIVIAALCCCAGAENSSTNTAAAVASSSSEVLVLNSLQQQQEAAKSLHATASRRSAAAAEQQQQQQQGVVWSMDACPAAVLKAFHAAAAATLKQQTFQAIQTAGTVAAEGWAGSCCPQALLLADRVHWTRAVATSLQQLAAGNSHALRALADSAVLQLENVTTALRRNRQGVNSGHTAGQRQQQQQQAVPEVLVVDDQQRASSQQGQQQLGALRSHGGGRMVAQQQQGQEQQQQQQHLGAVRSSGGDGGRAATPDPAESPRELGSHWKRSGIVNSSSSSSNDQQTPATDAAANTGLPLSRHTVAQQVSNPGSSSRSLTRQQLLGLQLLVTAGACHREVAAALVAAGVEGSSDFEWGQQLRYYWQAEAGQLQVCFGPCQVPYGWEYCPAATSSLIQPLASGLLSGNSLLAAAAATIHLPPVVGIDLLSWAGSSSSSSDISRSGRGSMSATAAAAAVHQRPAAAVFGLQQPTGSGDSCTPSTVSNLPSVVDVLGSVLGIQTVHLSCNPGTNNGSLQDWLTAVAAGAGVESAGHTLSGGVLGSISGLHHLAPSVLAAFSSSLCRLQQQRAEAHQQKRTAKSEGEAPSLALPKGDRPNPSRLALFCEIPLGSSAAIGFPSTTAAADLSTRSEVLGILQQYGRCVAVQPPGTALLLECVLRQLGLVDCAGAAALLAVLLQQAADQAVADQPAHHHHHHQQQQDGKQAEGATSHFGSYALVRLAAVQQVQQHLVGLQQTRKPEVQPGSSAWGVLKGALEQCILPVLPEGSHAVLVQSLEAGLGAAVKSGRVTQPVTAANVAGGVASASPQKQGNIGASLASCKIPGTPRVCSLLHSCSDLDVRQAVLQLCKLTSGRNRARSATASSTGSIAASGLIAESSNRVFDSSGSDIANGLPVMHADAAAAACSNLHMALQLHGSCYLVGPTAVGKTLTWNTLQASYNSIAAAEEESITAATAPVWVHCYPEALLEAAGGAAAATAESLHAVIKVYHTSVLQAEVVKQRSLAGQNSTAVAPAAPPTAAAGSTTIPHAGLQALQEHGAAAAVPPNILVLDVQQLGGPLLHFITELLQQRSRRALTAHSADQLPLLWQLPGCIGVVIECCNTSPPAAAATAGSSLSQQQLLLLLLQQTPVVAVRPPGLLDGKQQLALELRAAFKPLAVLPQSPHCTGLAQAGASHFGGGLGYEHSGVGSNKANDQSAPFNIDKLDSQQINTFIGGTTSSSTDPALASAAAEHSSNTTLQAPQKAVPAGCCGPALQVEVSHNMLDSLAALLQDLVGAGLALSSSSRSTVGEWETGILAVDYCRNAVAVAAAMWAQSTPCQARRTCLVASSSSNGITTKVSADEPGSSSSWCVPAASATPAEQFAAKLLVFCASWVIAGHCKQHQMRQLNQTLSAVLSGAGFCWTEPPASLGGLFSARLDLGTGLWVTWVQDVTRLSNLKGYSRIGSVEGAAAAAGVEQVDLPYHVCDAGFDLCFVGSTNGASADGGSGHSPDAIGWQHYNSSSAGGGGGPVISSSSSSCGKWRPGGLFLASPRTCALQCLLYWFLAAGKSPLLLARPGSGVKTAVRQLITHTWPSAAAAAAAGGGPSSSSGGVLQGSAEGITLLPLPSGLSAQQLGACLQQQLHCCVTGAAQNAAPTAAAAAVRSARRSSVASDRRISYGANSEADSSNPDGSSTYRSSMMPGSNTYCSTATYAAHHSSRRHQASATAAADDSNSTCSLSTTSATAAVPFDQPVVLYIEDCTAASSSSSMSWIKQLLESNCCTVLDSSTVASAERAVAAAATVPVQQPQLLAINMVDIRSDSSALCGSSSIRQMLEFNAECVCCLPDTCILQANFANSSNARGLQITATSAGANRASTAATSTCLISSSEVLSGLFQHYSPHIPRVHEVTKPQLIQALQSVMWGLTTVMQHLQQQQLVPMHCCFEIRHYRQCIDAILGLCAEHLAQLDSDKKLGDPQAGTDSTSDQAAAAAALAAAMNPTTPGPHTPGPESPWAYMLDPRTPKTPHTPHTPGMSLAPGGSFAEGLLGAGGLGARRISLKALCCAVGDVLCRCVCDGAATAAEQRGLQRLVLLLITEHLAVIDQPPPGSSTSGSSAGSSSSSHGSILAQTLLTQQAAAAAGTRCGSRSAAAGGSSRGNWIAEMLEMLTAGKCITHAQPYSSSSSRGSNSKETLRAWQQLQQMSDSAYSEAVSSALLPRTLSNRVLVQVSHIAGLGRDPVLNMEGLHVTAAQQELQQLLLQQTAAAAAGLGNEGCLSRLGSKLALLTAGGSSSGSRGGLVTDRMSAIDVTWVQKLLPCSAFVAAAHKLMWWMQGCIRQQQQQQQEAQAAANTTLCLEASLVARSAAAAAAVPSQSATAQCTAVLQPSNMGSAASVALLSGEFLPAIRAVAAAAAAAVGASVMELKGCAAPATADQQIVEAMQSIAAAAANAQAAAAAAAVRRGSTRTWAAGDIEQPTLAAAAAAAAAAQQSSASLSASAYRVSLLSSGPSAAQGEEILVDTAGAALQQQQQQRQLIILLDLHDCAELDRSVLQLLQRWLSREPCSYTALVHAMQQQQQDAMTKVNNKQQQQQQQSAPGDWSTMSRAQQQQQQRRRHSLAASPPGAVNASAIGHSVVCSISVSSIILCTPSQQQQLLTAIPELQQQHVCIPNMSIPAVQLQEQLTADCRSQLMSHNGSALLEHVRDVHTLVTHQQQQQRQQWQPQRIAAADLVGAPHPNEAAVPSEGAVGADGRKPIQQQQQPGGQISLASGAAAVPTESAARHLADRLSSALADIHQSAFAAYKQVRSLPHSSSSSSSGAKLVSQAVPLSKPFDMLLLLAQLIEHCRQPLAARRNSLQSCLSKVSKTVNVLEQQIVKEQQQQQQGGRRLEVLIGLKGKLARLTDKWTEELHQKVAVKLTQVLPTALLASLELVYLGGLPKATQQQLLLSWQQKILAAVAGRNPTAAGNEVTLDSAAKPSTAAAAAGFFVESAYSARSGNASDRPVFHGRCLINLPAHGTAAAATAAAAGTAAGSDVVGQLSLLQPEGPLHQQIRFAAAAAALTAQCGMPLLVTDPWNLLPGLLLSDTGSAAAAEPGSSNGWEVISPCDQAAVAQGSPGPSTVVHQVLYRVQAALEAGSNVCLQLQCNAATACEIATAAAALHTYMQLQEAAAAAADDDQDGQASPDSSSPVQAGPGSSSSSRTLDRSAKSRKSIRASSAYSSSSHIASAASSRGFNTGSATSAAAAVREALGPQSPRLVLQIVSSVFGLPAALVGLCQVIDLGGLIGLDQQMLHTEDRATAQQQKTLQHQQQQQQKSQHDQLQARHVSAGEYMFEYVMKLVLETVAADPVAAVAAAACEAEACMQQHQSDETKLMRRLTQELTSAATTPVLLESLASSVDDLAATAAEAARLTAAAASAAAQLAALWQPLAAAIAQCIQKLLLVCGEHGYVLPWEVIELAVRRAVAVAVDDSNSNSSRSSEADHELLEQGSIAAGDRHNFQQERPQHVSEAIVPAAVLLLQRHLATLLPPELQHQLQQLWQQQQLARQLEPPEMLLYKVLDGLPATVPIAVTAQHVAAATAAVKAAGVAAGLSDSSITVWGASQLMQTVDGTTDIGGSSSSRVGFLKQCKAVLGALDADHEGPRHQQRMQQRQQQQQSWFIIRLDDISRPVIQAASECIQEVRVLLQQQQQQQHGQSSGSRSRHSSGLRLWLAIPYQVARIFSQATGGSCLLFNITSPHPGGAVEAVSPNSTVPNFQFMGAMLDAEAAVQAAVTLRLLPAGVAGAGISGDTASASVFARGGPGGVSSSSKLLCILQPLMLAVVKARCMWEQELSAISSRGGRSHRGAQLVPAVDMHGPWDLAHLYLVLHQIAAATEAALSDQHANTSSRSSRRDQPPRSLKHRTHVPLDLEQLHKLIIWAILGPGCSTKEARDIAQAALEDCLSPSGLGVRVWDVAGRVGVQVLGDVIADTFEAVDRQLAVQQAVGDEQEQSGSSLAVPDSELGASAASQYRNDGSTSSGSGSSGDLSERHECLLPLGMALGRKQLWALLQSQQQS